jgi:hypothetical protein
VIEERRCAACDQTEETERLERCVVCGKWFCPDCAYKASGRRFCSQHCSVQFYYGDIDDDEDDLPAGTD